VGRNQGVAGIKQAISVSWETLENFIDSKPQGIIGFLSGFQSD
jgi:hypothetical protein